jgi:hypothetical protein
VQEERDVLVHDALGHLHHLPGPHVRLDWDVLLGPRSLEGLRAGNPRLRPTSWESPSKAYELVIPV